jgi:hypothetical protein
MPHGVKSLLLWGMAAGEHLRRQDPAAQRHGGRPKAIFYFFKKNHF